ncbi:uncharacterized protein LOC125757015 [Rhipicephalus sanguineus]|uniref:uncharacterized protein LOC125757015 n=1 Tax=Rhipicephalus sanguineus TaxID=34632 RepID=UPI0020C21E99|nr:uncharacterized protein LOC125757015 [Rhipicephalus sanguineus]
MLSDYHYREICRKKSTGQGGITWKFYWEIHQFLGTLPVNDRSLTEEIGCGPGETVDQIVHSMVHGTSEEEAVCGEPDLPSPARSPPQPSRPPSPVTADGADRITSTPSVPTTPAENTRATAPLQPTKRTKSDSRRNHKDTLLAQLVEEQKLMRQFLESSKKQEQEARERLAKFQEKAGEREDRLIGILEKIANQ